MSHILYGVDVKTVRAIVVGRLQLLICQLVQNYKDSQTDVNVKELEDSLAPIVLLRRGLAGFEKSLSFE